MQDKVDPISYVDRYRMECENMKQKKASSEAVSSKEVIDDAETKIAERTTDRSSEKPKSRRTNK